MSLTSSAFLFIFLPLSLLIFKIVPYGWQNRVLIALSLIFAVWSGPLNSLVLLASIVGNHVASHLMARFRGKVGTIIFWIAISANVSVLAWYKHLAGGDSTMPLGISFYTFLAISYLTDLHIGIIPAPASIGKTALFFTFFPRLIAGPLVRFNDFTDGLVVTTVMGPEFADGVRRFIRGCARKVLISTPLIVAADNIMSRPPQSLDLPVAWLGAVLYALAVYHDFGGYSDIAIGLALMFGYRLPENFNFPYSSRSFVEFWRRWHITLSEWLRDYLFYPLSRIMVTEAFRGKMAKSKVTMLTRTCFSLCLVFTVCGVWHGWGVNFVMWGLLHGIFLSFEQTSFGKRLLKAPVMFQRTYFLLLITLSWIPFRIGNPRAAFDYFKAAVTPSSTQSILSCLDNVSLLAAIFALLFSFPYIENIIKRWSDPVRKAVEIPAYLLLFGLSLASIAGSSVQSFIYARF